jgi:ABC-type multidrug transport system fused ATPase/permease subunit
MLGVAGENLTFNVRKDLIRGVIFKQLSWFDSEARAPGALTNVMSEDIQTLNAMTTETIVVVIEAMFNIVCGVAIGAFLCWQQTVYVLLLSPIMIIGGWLTSRL